MYILIIYIYNSCMYTSNPIKQKHDHLSWYAVKVDVHFDYSS